MSFKKWVTAETDKALAKTLSEECDVDPITALIACGRGYTDPGELEQFLSDEIMISDPHELADIEKAAEIINLAAADDTLIAVYGDYDCDGITATALLYDYLSGRNIRAVTYIPERLSEGYGMNKAAVDRLNAMGVGLIVTVDNGICCNEEIEYAHSLGMKVVVTDHHIPSDKLPCAEAVVDPHREDCASSYKQICGAEVAFKLVCVLEGKEPEELLDRYSDLLTVAVIADVMPLEYENRCIVKAGLKKLRRNPRTGIAAIMSVAGIDRGNITAGRVAFGICPRINAAGRMDTAEPALKMLLCDNMMDALVFANLLDEENALRQKAEKNILNEAVGIIEKNGYCYNRIIVVEGEGWHQGIVGIVAARICEKYGKPAILLSVDGDTCSGSGRSYKGFSLYNAIKSAEEHTLKFGGHELAAGVMLKTADVDKFRNAVNTYAEETEYCPPELKIDCRLNPKGLSLDVAYAIKELEPFGSGNPMPIFGIYGVTLQKITPIASGKHLRLLFSKENNSFQSLLFGVTPEDFCFNCGDMLDLAVTLDVNIYNGSESLSVQIKNMRLFSTDDDALFKQLAAFDGYMCNKTVDTSLLLPSRAEVGTVYKFITACAAYKERVKYHFINTIGYSKTMISIMTLEELGLVKEDEKHIISAASVHTKTELTNSETYRFLYERSENNEGRSL